VRSLSSESASRQIVLRDARIGDANDIVAAVRAGFTDQELALFVYGCQGIRHYVEYELALPAVASPAIYVIAERNETVAGCADFRIDRESLFLNYISVFPEHRSLGIGTSLLADGIRRAESVAGQLLLDVFEANAPALTWYRRLGLSRIGQTAWWEVPQPEIRDEVFRVTGWAQAQACQKAFTFSTFSITTPSNSYFVGRLGSDWFRITTPGALVDGGVWAALKAIDPNRRVLALVEEGAMLSRVEHAGRRLISTVRLSGRLCDIRARLRC
jgi:ribosomal protein S18 acetylase RimI-like enzyme